MVKDMFLHNKMSKCVMKIALFLKYGSMEENFRATKLNIASHITKGVSSEVC